MGLFDSVTQIFQDNVAGNANDTVQNVTDGISQVTQEGGVAETMQNLAGDQLAEAPQQAEEALQNPQEWVNQLTNDSEEQ